MSSDSSYAAQNAAHLRPHDRLGERAGDGGPSLWPVLGLVLRHRRLTLGPPLVLFVLVVGLGLLGPRAYTAAAAFMPQAPQGARASLSGLAAQFGLNLSSAEPGQSPAFYVELLRSRELLGRVVDGRYTFPTDTGTVNGTLVEILPQTGRNAAERREATIDALDDALRADPGLKTGIVEFSITARWPELAYKITQQILEQVNDFDLNRRRSRAGAERRFIEVRMQEAKADLTRVEERLQGFLQGNRDFVSASELAFRRQRLEREVEMRQQVYTWLAQSYEQARIDEVRDTPALTLVEQPLLPARPDRRGLVKKGLLTLLLGGVIGVLAALAGESYARRRAEGSSDLAELVVLGDRLSDRWGRLRRRRPAPR